MKKDELTHCLEQVFDFMSQKGVQFSNDDKKSIIDDLSETLQNTVSLNDMNDKNFQNKLLHTINSKLLGDDKEYQSMKNTLKGEEKTHNMDPKAKAKAETSSILVMTMSKMMPGKEGNKDKEESLIQKLTSFTNIFQKKRKEEKEKDKGKDKEAKDPGKLEEEQIEATLRNLNGGDNPNAAGEHQFPIIGPIFGNLMALTNQCTPDEKSVSAMVEAVTHNAGKPDPAGTEVMAKVADMSVGIEVKHQGPTPLHTEPKKE